MSGWMPRRSTRRWVLPQSSVDGCLKDVPQIYHATCYAEMVKARTTARLLKEERERSSSLDLPTLEGTPLPEEVQAAPSSDSVVPEEVPEVVEETPQVEEAPQVIEGMPQVVAETMEDQTAPTTDLQVPQVDSNLLQAVAGIFNRSTTPDSESSRNGKRPAEDEDDLMQVAKKVKQETD